MNRQAAKPHSCNLPAISSNQMAICQIVFMNQHFLDGEIFQRVAFQMEDLRFFGELEWQPQENMVQEVG